MFHAWRAAGAGESDNRCVLSGHGLQPPANYTQDKGHSDDPSPNPLSRLARPRGTPAPANPRTNRSPPLHHHRPLAPTTNPDDRSRTGAKFVIVIIFWRSLYFLSTTPLAHLAPTLPLFYPSPRHPLSLISRRLHADRAFEYVVSQRTEVRVPILNFLFLRARSPPSAGPGTPDAIPR